MILHPGDEVVLLNKWGKRKVGEVGTFVRNCDCDSREDPSLDNCGFVVINFPLKDHECWVELKNLRHYNINNWFDIWNP